MIRITNSMMNNNTKNNINLTKSTADKLNTMVSTGQKITKPSDDPVIAIRALRFNTSLSQLNQYYEKNIPDAQAWLKITETALSQTDQVFSSIKENLTTGASDNNTESDRMKILESLKALRDQIYASGNADYADRTVFTGYRTSESLTVLETDDLSKIGYESIVEPLDVKDIENITYISGVGYDANGDGDITTQDVQSNEVSRLRLSYDTIDADKSPLKIQVNGTDYVTCEVVSLSGDASVDDKYYTNPPAGKAYLIADTGEIVLSSGAKSALEGANGDITITYGKSSFQPGDLRPEHYFSCIDKDGIHYNYDEDKSTTPSTYTANFQKQEIKYEISYNQTITINTNAGDSYSHDIGRDVDELVDATQAVINAANEMERLEKKGLKSGDAEYDAAKKAYDLLADKSQKMFSAALDRFDGYSEKVNLAISSIGSLSARISITKERVSDQIQSIKTLADTNINAELTDTAIDLSNAELALEAAQMSAAKIAQQTLLNYL